MEELYRCCIFALIRGLQHVETYILYYDVQVISIFQDLSEEDSYQFWEIIRVDKEWQAALEQIRPSKGLRDHFRELFQLMKKRRNWMAVTEVEQYSMPGAPNPQVLRPASVA